MIVCHDPRFVFLHVPRTGGTSFYAAVSAALPHAVILNGPTQLDTHRCAAEARRLWPDHQQIAVMRNPWTLTASIWRMCRQCAECATVNNVTPDDAGRVLAYGSLAFPDFVRRVIADGFFVPRGGFSTVYTDAGTRVFLYEADPYRRIGEMLGVKLNLPWLNHCDGEEGAIWDDDTLRLVGDRCRWDVERFGYRPPR